MNYLEIKMEGFTPADRLELIVELEKAEFDRSYLRDKEWLAPHLRDEHCNPTVIILPWEDFRNISTPVFPSGTADLFTFLTSTEIDSVDIAVGDEEYSEVSLNADIIFTPTFLATSIVLPILIGLLVEWLKKLLLERSNAADIKFSVYIEYPDGGTKHLTYEGPVNTFESIIQTQLKSDTSLAPKQASMTTQDD